MTGIQIYHSKKLETNFKKYLIILLAFLILHSGGIIYIIQSNSQVAFAQDYSMAEINGIVERQVLETMSNRTLDSPFLENLDIPTIDDSIPKTFNDSQEDNLVNITIIKDTEEESSESTINTGILIDDLEIIYPLNNLNVYNGPGSDYKIIGSIESSVATIKVGAVNEWTLIKYEEDFGYILIDDTVTESSVIQVDEVETLKETEEYVVKNTNISYPKETSVQQAQVAAESFKKFGTAGRLYVNGFDVAVYNDGSSGSQKTVDAKDSASMFRASWTTIICDHTNQGFSAIKGVRAGDEAYIKYEDGSVLTLVCTGKDNGHNLLGDLVDSNGVSVFGNYPIVMYTCNENWQNITLVYWDIK